MRRHLTVIAIAAAATLLSAGPAWAHEEITPSSIPTGKPVFLTLSAANEKAVDLVSIALAAPAGAPFGAATLQPAGWTAQRSAETITWSGDAVKPENFEHWGFEVEGVDQPGQLQYKVTLGFAGGDTEAVDVVVDAVAPGAVGATPATSGATPTSAAVSTTVAPPTGGADAAAPAAKSASSGSSGSSGRANAALAIAIAAGVLAVAAAVLAVRRRSTLTAPAGPTKPDQDF